MVSLFKVKSAASVLGLIIFSILIHARFIDFPPQVIINPSDGLLYYILLPLKQLPSLALSVIYQLIILLQAFRFNYIMNDVRMYPKPAYTAALAFILLTGLLPQWGNISASLLSNSILLWFLFFIMKSYNSQKPGTLVFNTGLVAAVAVLLNYSLFPLLIVSFLALAIIRPFRITEWFILLSGVITPFYFAGGYLFLTDNMVFAKNLLHIFQWHIIKPDHFILTVITLAVSGCIIICGIYMIQANSSRMMLQARKSWTIILFLFIFLIPANYFVKDNWPYTLLSTVITAAAFISYTFIHPKKNIIPVVFFWLMIAISVYNNWIFLKT